LAAASLDVTLDGLAVLEDRDACLGPVDRDQDLRVQVASLAVAGAEAPGRRRATVSLMVATSTDARLPPSAKRRRAKRPTAWVDP
jgi:hypothetical protein